MDYNPDTGNRRTDELAARKLSYNVAEATKALGIGRTRLMELVREDKIECRRFGKVNLIPAASLEAFLATLPKRPAGEAFTKRAA